MPRQDGGGERSTTEQVLHALESLQRAGITHLPRGRRGARPTAPLAAEPPATGQAAAAAMPEVGADSETGREERSTQEMVETMPQGVRPMPLKQRIEALRVLQEEVSVCVRCHELAETRTQTVFGVGNPRARLVFCGEAPGADEDRQGEPFVGRAGQLLDKIIEACTLRREDVYILNVLKCRPPGNRNPLPLEVSNCRGYLDRQLEIIQPEFICCLGSVAAKTLLETETSIGKLRGKFHLYRGIPVLCTYHPAYLLRNPAAKRDVWEDMQMLMREMGIELPRRGR